jgi:cardiolipin synthase
MNCARKLRRISSLRKPSHVTSAGMLLAASLLDRAHLIWHLGIAGLALLLSVLASGHAVLYKRDSRSAIAWVGFVWVLPLIGAVLYFIFGVNRIRRHAALLRGELERYRAPATEAGPVSGQALLVPAGAKHLEMLARVVGSVVERPLLAGNQIEPLVDGDEAYPVMLDAIRQARQTIALETYIFDRDPVGLEFAHALGDAVRRGVAVRVLVDAMGLRYSFPSILRTLRHEGVPFARFLPSLNPFHLMSLNLRTHRKILVIDGQVGFTGGMNIRAAHCLNRKPDNPTHDLHFRVQGPIVTQLQEAFADDWLFATNETLRGAAWFPNLEPAGATQARGVTDGPDEDFEKLRWTILGALSIAQTSVKIMTPYFLPDTAIVSALNLAAMRGVRVDIILPGKNNLPFVDWASRALWWQILTHGCKLWLTPGAFDHSKLMLVDGCWTLLGSANWDARSLRLNFEFNVECYDAALCQKLAQLADAKLNSAHLVTLEEIDQRPLLCRLRDGVARLFMPYL